MMDGAALSSAAPHAPVRRDAARARHDSESSSAGKAWRVLVVDDQPDMTSMMQLMLSRRGYCVATASSARHAIEVARDFQPNLIISDIGMPDMDGCAMMRALRVEGQLPPFKAIALTGFGLPTDQERARDAGFDFCLVKPLDFATFFGCIEKMMEQQSREMVAEMAVDIALPACLHAASEPCPSFDSGLDSARLSAMPAANASH